MKILIGTDGSEYSRAAVAACCRLIGPGKGTAVRVVGVYQPQVLLAAEPFAISAEYYQKLDQFAHDNARIATEEACAIIRDRLKDAAPDVTTVVSLGRPAEILVDCAKEWKADLVVVGSHGRGFWGRLTLGSVSDAVVHHAPCSVLIVRP